MERKEYMWRRYILRFFSDYRLYGNKRNKAEVSITRSLKNLFKKGYIDLALGWFGGGQHLLEETKEGLEANYKELKRLENGGRVVISPIDKKPYDINYMNELIAKREKIVKERILQYYEMEHNIKRLKLTDKGIKLAKSLNVKNSATPKT
ncbi:hypothetical protein ES705_44772 [subsurface metagenome]